MRNYTTVLKSVVLIGCVVAQTPLLAAQKSSFHRDVRRGEIVEAKTYPWSAIGKLNNGAGGACTAVMVSPDYALTAAHCLFLRRTRRFLPAQSLHLVLGYENQRFRDHFRISAYYVPPAYDASRPYESLAHDWALLRVANKNRSRAHTPSIKNFKVPDAPVMPLLTAGYSHFRPYLMTADRDCRLLGRSDDKRLLFDSCHAPSGFSGAPVLASDDQGESFSIAGIHVANQVWHARTIAIAIPVDRIWPKIKPCVTNHRCEFQVVATGKDPTAAEVLSGLPRVGLPRTAQADRTREASCGIDTRTC